MDGARVLDGIRYATAVKLVYGRLYSMEQPSRRERARLTGRRHLDGFIDMPQTLHKFLALSQMQLDSIRYSRFLIHSDCSDVRAFCDLSERDRTEWLAKHSEEDILMYQSQESLPDPVPVDVEAVHPYITDIPSAEQSSSRESRSNRRVGPVDQDDHFYFQNIDMSHREMNEEMPVVQEDRRQVRDAEWQAERARLLEHLQEYETLAVQAQRDRQDAQEALEEARQQLARRQVRDAEWQAERAITTESDQISVLKNSTDRMEKEGGKAPVRHRKTSSSGKSDIDSTPGRSGPG